MRYVALALKDPLNLFYHKWHFLINSIYAVILAAIDPHLLLSLWLVPAALAWFMTGWGVAVWSHQRGSIRYQLPNPDHSRNNHIVGILGFGEGYQNNHHHTPYKPKHSQGPWEFDPLGRILELISKPKT
jgi:stearoyl-CoA desaturase (delta-9 desaturase)